ANLGRYFIYGVTVLAPISGRVLRAANGYPDLPPGELRNDNVPGNHVIIRPDGLEVNILLAHLQNSSVLVKTGDRVTAGQPIGKVGSSGRTSEPHLHIHAQKEMVKDGKSEWVGVPIRFGSRWLVRNSLVMT
ncbi:MAG: M23 family metallopeptidase, partial [Verrucomicrobia bacterium]|nr:M23 family metallopeptidase [Verrucomicrobiota bacterium]